MAITREKKEQVVTKVADLANTSKLMVFANYSGLSVADMQSLRKKGREQGVTVTVAKNRLVKRALSGVKGFADVDTGMLSGQVLLAAGDDEVAPAQVLAEFAKAKPALEVSGGITSDGEALGVDNIKALAQLPSKDVLRGQLVGTIAAPLSGFASVLGGNIRGLVQALNAQAAKQS